MTRFIRISVIVLLLAMIAIAFAQGELPPAEIPLMLSTILGVLAPIIIQAVVRNVKAASTRAVIAILLSAGIGLIAALVTGVTISLAPVYVAWVFTVSQSAFNLFWKPLFNATGFLKKSD